mmetsp:Transcript_19384/g.67490  ORF Transcript_19384/g.67490 Transcript_19384/m.67490 type:complete len:390 (-) Transcript_19384:1193-2362(-)
MEDVPQVRCRVVCAASIRHSGIWQASISCRTTRGTLWATFWARHVDATVLHLDLRPAGVLDAHGGAHLDQVRPGDEGVVLVEGLQEVNGLVQPIVRAVVEFRSVDDGSVCTAHVGELGLSLVVSAGVVPTQAHHDRIAILHVDELEHLFSGSHQLSNKVQTFTLDLAIEQLVQQRLDNRPASIHVLCVRRAQVRNDRLARLQRPGLAEILDVQHWEGQCGRASTDRLAQLLKHRRQQSRHGSCGDALAASSSGFCAFLDGIKCVGAICDGLLDDCLRHAMAVANQIVLGEFRAVAAIIHGDVARQQLLRREASEIAFLRDRKQLGVVSDVSDEDTTEQLVAGRGEDQFLVHPLVVVLDNQVHDLRAVVAVVIPVEPKVGVATEGGKIHA